MDLTAQLIKMKCSQQEGGAGMPRAILKDGVIYPLDPLPPNWRNGMELRVEDAQSLVQGSDEIDHKFRELEEAVRQIDPKNFAEFEAALQEADRIAKAKVKQEIGQP